MELFALETRKGTGEKHLFLDKKVNGECRSDSAISICRKMNRSEASITHCASPQLARAECAKIGRSVCGSCVSHLYTTYS
ncbi:hypothetical protein NIBR502774_18875 (plasmid) [Rhizobium sp. NIBRBAC000502774]|nr:hypothetical protein NIBR502774_18875 [Rhizobium sp. NIBRBAC000502774]